MSDAFIIDGVRTPVGKLRGMLHHWHPADLLAHTFRALIDRVDIDPAELDDVIVGCLDQVGEQSINIARSAALAAGFPETVPACTIDRQCGSSQQAAHFAAQGIMAGVYDLVLVGGVESMTRVPMWANAPIPGEAYGPGFRSRFDFPEQKGIVNQGESGEMVAEQWGLEREELDHFAMVSHQRAAAATADGRFEREIIPTEADREGQRWTATQDEGIRPNTTMEVLAGLKTVFRENGRLTAATSSQLSDGAAALLVASEDAVRRLGLTPMARFHGFGLGGVDPILGLAAPAPSTISALKKAKMTIDDIDIFEVSEAFASVPLAWARDTGADLEKVNVNGGAIALGHPLGASGARIMTTLVHEMQRSKRRFGLQTMCEGGGLANATILEAV